MGNNLLQKSHRDSFFVTLDLGSHLHSALFSIKSIYGDKPVVILQVLPMSAYRPAAIMVELVEHSKYLNHV